MLVHFVMRILKVDVASTYLPQGGTQRYAHLVEAHAQDLMWLCCIVPHVQIRPLRKKQAESSLAPQAVNPGVYVTMQIREPFTVDGGEPFD
jgi:hypothetical protein